MRNLLILSLLFSVNAMAQPMKIDPKDKDHEIQILKTKLAAANTRADRAEQALTYAQSPKGQRDTEVTGPTIQTLNTPGGPYRSIEWRSAIDPTIVCTSLQVPAYHPTAPSCVRR